MLRLLPSDSQRGGAQARYMREPAHEVDAVASTWVHGLAPENGGLLRVHFPSRGYEVTTASAVRGAHERQARVLRLLPKERQRIGAQARYSRKLAHEVDAAAGT